MFLVISFISFVNSFSAHCSTLHTKRAARLMRHVQKSLYLVHVDIELYADVLWIYTASRMGHIHCHTKAFSMKWIQKRAMLTSKYILNWYNMQKLKEISLHNSIYFPLVPSTLVILNVTDTEHELVSRDALVSIIAQFNFLLFCFCLVSPLCFMLNSVWTASMGWS